MDERDFDRLSRLLGGPATRRAGLKAALAAVFGAGAAAEAEARRRRQRGEGKDAEDELAARRRRKRKCTPECAAGQSCVKGACVCDDGGTACGANCCALGQRCEGGQCVSEPQPDACIAFGEPCKGVGRRCCEGLTCGSGQGGLADVACYVRKTGPCTSTAECTYGTRCEDGICKGIPQPTPTPPGPQCVAKGGTCPAETACCDGTRCVDGSCSDCQTTAAHLVNYTQSNGNNGFNKPREAAFLADGRMLIADQDNSRFQIWTQSGGTWSYQASIPAGKYSGTCPNITAGTTSTASTANPYALAVDPLDPGVFYYVEQYGCFVMGCTGSGTSWTCTPAINENNFPTVVEINDLAFDSAGRMFLVQESGAGDAVMIDRPTGGWAADKANWPLTPTAVFFANIGQGASDDPQGITVGPDGLVYVADTDKNRITVWKETSPGTFSLDSEFGTAGSGVGNLNKPRGVEVLDGTVVVTDSGNARISLWKQDGGTWTNTDTFPNPATAGSGTAQLNSPSHCLPSADGRFYVADTNNNRISVWKETCK